MASVVSPVAAGGSGSTVTLSAQIGSGPAVVARRTVRLKTGRS